MFVVVWRGFGFLTFFIGIFGLLAGLVLAARLSPLFGGTAGTIQGHSFDWGMGLGILIAAAINWVLGRWLNKRAAFKAMEAGLPQPTGWRHLFAGRHSFMAVNMEYWSILAALFAVIGIVASSF